MIQLTERDQYLLSKLRIFPHLDKGSQDRIRKEIDERRKESPDFDEAFGGALSGGVDQLKKEGDSIFKTMVDVVLHPVSAVKGKVGEVLLKRRNEAPEILIHPNPILSQVADPWDFAEDDSKRKLIAIVRQLGGALRGVNYGDRLGIAAPQIGIPKRIFVCQGAVCVNPTMEVPKVGEMIDVLESCYSLPGKQIWKTKRHKYIWATWYSIEGQKRSFKLKGLDAIVFQHELSHLDGQCCCDLGELQETK